MRRRVGMLSLFICGLIGFFALGWISASCVSVASRDSITTKKISIVAAKILDSSQPSVKKATCIDELVEMKVCSKEDIVDAWGGKIELERSTDDVILLVSRGDPLVRQRWPNVSSTISCRIPIAQHIDSALAKTNNLVSINIVPAKGNPSSPQVKTIYCPYAELVSSNAVAESVSVDCIICIENSSEWPYEFGTPYSLSGYDCLEMELMLDSGETVALKCRHPKYLSDKGEFVRILPRKKWEYPVSLDSRLWLMPAGLATNRILNLTVMGSRFAA